MALACAQMRNRRLRINCDNRVSYCSIELLPHTQTHAQYFSAAIYVLVTPKTVGQALTDNVMDLLNIIKKKFYRSSK